MIQNNFKKMMLFTKEQIAEAIATPTVLSLLQIPISMFGFKYNTEQSLYDAAIMFASLSISKILNNKLVPPLIGQFQNYYAANLTSFLTYPVLNYFTYNWFFDRIFKTTFKSYNRKSSKMSVILPAMMAIVGMAIDKGVIMWITGGKQMSYYEL
uniref:Tlr 3Fp protein n=1 Tax=Tetrahymena thermophila TaxID=5911 RepID=Q8WRB0_TETTH|nr:Tlr 3Fp protein [Tetrahymena thermophila]